MPRLARPIHRSRRRICPAQHRLQEVKAAFAAINLPPTLPENPLKDIQSRFDFPWLMAFGENDGEGHPNKRRLLTVSEFFRYTEEQGNNDTM
jgi:hypothetical protein